MGSTSAAFLPDLQYIYSYGGITDYAPPSRAVSVLCGHLQQDFVIRGAAADRMRDRNLAITLYTFRYAEREPIRASHRSWAMEWRDGRARPG
jgi:hypothetical protein